MEKKKSNMGRPKGSVTRGDTVRVTVYLSPEAAEKLQRLTNANGGNKSLYVESLIQSTPEA